MEQFYKLFQTYMKHPNEETQDNLYEYTNHILETQLKSALSIHHRYYIYPLYRSYDGL